MVRYYNFQLRQLNLAIEQYNDVIVTTDNLSDYLDIVRSVYNAAAVILNIDEPSHDKPVDVIDPTFQRLVNEWAVALALFPTTNPAPKRAARTALIKAVERKHDDVQGSEAALPG